MSNKASSHWFNERFSAIILIFLSSFSLYKVFAFINSGEQILNIFNMPFSLLLIILFVIIGLYHASMGMEVILDDYVVCPAKKGLVNFGIKIVNTATIGFLLIAMFYGYFKAFTVNDEVGVKSQAMVEKQNDEMKDDEVKN